MKVLIAASRRDQAAMNIASKLIELYKLSEEKPGLYRKGNVALALIDENGTLAEDLDERFRADSIIFASRHSSKAGVPSLLVHAPGNFSDARFGGRPRELAIADPFRAKTALVQLDISDTQRRYAVSLEATHHGPTSMQVPVLFVEIGSLPPQWTDEDAGVAVAKAIWKAAAEPSKDLPAVGFGGTHYAPAITRIALEERLAVGHIVPKYALPECDNELLRCVLRKSIAKPKVAIVDWKGMRSNDRERVLNILRDEEVEVVKA